MKTAQKAQSTTKKPENTCEDMLNDIRDSLSNYAFSNDEDDGEEEENKKDDI
jgi:hypothetical protein